MDDKIKEKYAKNRRNHPWMSAKNALDWAKRERDYSADWDYVSNTGSTYSREVDGFTVTLKINHDSQFPEDGDMGHYVNGISSYNWSSGEWSGNYPEPNEDFPLNLPYTSFASGSYSQDRHAYPYWVPDGVEEQFVFYRRNGASKSVAWDLTKEWVEQMIKDFFGGPLVYVYVTVTVSKDGIELGGDSIGTNYVDDHEGQNYPFQCVEEHGMIEEAMNEAKEAIKKLKEVEV